jgi:chromosome segregation ATPase
MGYFEMINDKSIPDTAVLTAPNGKTILMGEAREGYFSRERELDKREAEVTKSRGQLADVYDKFMQERSTLDAAAEDLARQRESLAAAVARTGEEGDVSGNVNNLISPAMKRIDELERKLNERAAKVDKLEKDMTSAISANLEERWDRDMESFGDEIPEGISRNDLVKHALAKHLSDKYGIPSVRQAAEDVLAPSRVEKKIVAAREEGARLAREEIALRGLGGPAGFQSVGIPGSETKTRKFGSIAEGIEAAAKDASIWMGGAGAGE